MNLLTDASKVDDFDPSDIGSTTTLGLLATSHPDDENAADDQ
jgi:hypothetical protein